MDEEKTKTTIDENKEKPVTDSGEKKKKIIGWISAAGGVIVTVTTILLNIGQIKELFNPGIEPTDFAFNDQFYGLCLGKTETIGYTLTPGDASEKYITWESDKPEIVTVNNGAITANGAGVALVSVELKNGIKRSINCYVTTEESNYLEFVDQSTAYTDNISGDSPYVYFVTNISGVGEGFPYNEGDKVDLRIVNDDGQEVYHKVHEASQSQNLGEIVIQLDPGEIKRGTTSKGKYYYTFLRASGYVSKEFSSDLVSAYSSKEDEYLKLPVVESDESVTKENIPVVDDIVIKKASVTNGKLELEIDYTGNNPDEAQCFWNLLFKTMPNSKYFVMFNSSGDLGVFEGNKLKREVDKLSIPASWNHEFDPVFQESMKDYDITGERMIEIIDGIVSMRDAHPELGFDDDDFNAARYTAQLKISKESKDN